MATRGLPHYWTPDQVKMILDTMPAGQPWLFALLLWRSALRQAEALNLEWRDLQFAGTQPSVTVRNGRAVSRGAGPPRACGRLSLGPSPEPCGQGVHRARWQATIPKERGPLDCRGDCESGIAGGCHRNRRQGPCLPQPAPQLRPPLAAVRPERQRRLCLAGTQPPHRALNTYLVLAPDTLGDISEVP